MLKNKLIYTLIIPLLALASCGNSNSEPAPDPSKKEMTDVVFENKQINYDGQPHTITATGMPLGSTTVYTNDGPFYDVGKYVINVKISHEDYKDYVGSAILTIDPIAMSGVKFENTTVQYSGSAYTITASGYPEGSQVTYTNAGPHTEVGKYTIGVSITHKNYKTYTSSAILTIESSVTPGESIGGIEQYNDSNWTTSNLMLLDCGSYQMPLPKNYKNPETLKTTLSADASSWSNNTIKNYSSFYSTNFRYTYKNSCDDGPTKHKTSPAFYATTVGEGLKLTQTGLGFQSQMFTHTGAKLEVHINLTTLQNASGQPDTKNDTAHIYFFNKNGKLIGTHSVEKGTLSTSNKNIKFYYTESNCKDIAYFEFRLIASPYKGSQCYNIGVGEVNFKSWERI